MDSYGLSFYGRHLGYTPFWSPTHLGCRSTPTTLPARLHAVAAATCSTAAEQLSKAGLLSRPRSAHLPFTTMVPKRKKTDEEKAFLKNRVHGSVICKLSRVCKYEPIVDEIQRSARELKQCQLEAWHVANVHVLRCLEEKLPLPSFDKTFFNRCCAGVMKEAEDKDREKRAQPPSSSKPRKQQRTMASQSVAATEEEEDARDDSQRKNARAQVEDAELINTFCLFWEQRASNPAYEPPSLEFSGAIREEVARAQMENTINMIALQFRRRLHQYIRFRYASSIEVTFHGRFFKKRKSFAPYPIHTARPIFIFH
jgi:hypothetical protein